MPRHAHSITITDKNGSVYEMLKREIAMIMELSTAAGFANSRFESVVEDGGSITVNFSYLPREENVSE